MSDVDYSGPAPIDPSDFILNEQRGAKIAALNSLDDDPEKATRAQQLSEATGANPALVYGDLEGFETQHKAALTTELLNNNAFLQTYVNSHPLAAKISNDDFGQLDAVSQATQKFVEAPGVGVVPANTPNTDWLSAPNKRLPSGDLPTGMQLLTTPEGNENLLKAVAKFPSEMIQGLTQSAVKAMQPGATTEDQIAFSTNVAMLLEGAKLPAPWAKGLRTLAPADIRLGRPEVPPISSTAEIIQFLKDVDTYATQAGQPTALKAMIPYIEAGKSPPVGIHPDVDAMHVEQAKADATNLSEALKESVASATRERSPELFTKFIAQHTDGEIGINADAVRKLVGDEPPVPGEGPLGFIPDLAAQLERAEATGGDINVSLAEYLGKVEPEVHKELEDHIRARPDGVTVEEGKELEKPEGTAVEPVETVRQAAGLKGAVPAETLTLQRTGPESDGFHTFDVMDASGQQKATLDLSETSSKKTINIEMLTAREGVGAIGPKGLSAIAEQIAKEFPNAEKIDYHHISGAKGEKPVTEIGKTSIDLGKIRERMALRAHGMPEEPEAPGLLQRAKEAIVGKSPKQLELDLKAIEERELFDKASAIGMTVDQYKRYAKLIEKRAGEDAEAASERALADQRKRQTQEWKTNRAELRPQVRDQVLARPEVELDEMLREGRVKLSKADLTPDQVALLPKDYVAADGIHPEDLAGLFGDSHAGALVDRLVALTQSRDAAGMKPKQHLERMVDAETDRQVEAKYGSLDKNILEEAKDQVLSETQESLLHEEVLARAEEAGMQLTITKDELKAAIKGFFDRMLVRDVSSDKGLAEAGRAGRAAEMALLKGDYAEAFRQKQRQFNAFTMATYAKKFEKVQAQFAKAAKRFSSREVSGVEQEYTNWVHDILGRVGSPVKRSVQDLADAIGRGEQKTLADFVEAKTIHDMREVPVAEFLMDPAFRKQAEDLTTADFVAMNDSIKALAKNGRDEMKIIKAGEEHDLDQVKAQMIEQLQAFVEKHYDAAGGRWLGPLPPGVAKPLRTYLVSHLQLESVFNRWDRGDPNGVFTQFVARELATAANSEAALERQFSVRLREVADKADLKERVENPIFKDPLGGEPIPMTRKNLRAILLNVGNDSNFTKLAKGYLGSISKGEAGKAEVEAFKAQITSWLHQHATKEDWDWAQKIGGIFADIKKQSDVMYRSLTGGVEPENIPMKPIDTPHGQYEGWYYPVVYHPVWEGASKKLMGGDPLEQVNYNRATTPAGYTKSRTGYAAPLALDLDMMPVRMRQMLHDIAFRPAVIQAGKIFYDKDVRAAVTKHYGEEYTKSLVPYLRDVANAANYRNDAQQVFTRFSEVIRQNIIATLIGLNPGTVLKHGPTAAMNSITEVGAVPFLKAVKGLFSINDVTGETNWAFAMKTSEELSRRHRFYRETLGGAQQEVMGTPSLRDQIVSIGSMPVAMSDLLSAVPTWMAKYESAMQDHGVHGDAVFEADRAVRRAHGSSVITNRPQVMRTGAMGSWLASLYGFFNHIMNRQYELAWKAGDTLGMVKEGDYAGAMKEVPGITGMLFSYVIFPAIVEELVTPLTTQKGDSWGKTAAKSLAYSISASWIGIRDIVAAAVNGRDPSIGLLTTAYKTVTDTLRDLEKDRPFSKQHAGALLQHSATTLGAATGLVNAQVGKAGRFGLDVANGQEKPKGPWGWMVGLRYGTLKNHSTTFQQYMKRH